MLPGLDERRGPTNGSGTRPLLVTKLCYPRGGKACKEFVGPTTTRDRWARASLRLAGPTQRLETKKTGPGNLSRRGDERRNAISSSRGPREGFHLYLVRGSPRRRACGLRGSKLLARRGTRIRVAADSNASAGADDHHPASFRAPNRQHKSVAQRVRSPVASATRPAISLPCGRHG